MRKPASERLGISDRAMAAARAALEAGAPLNQVIKQLRLGRVEAESARVFFKNTRSPREREELYYNVELDRLAQVRIFEIYRATADRINQAIEAQRDLINRFGHLDVKCDSLADQLTTLDRQLMQLKRIGISPRARPRLLHLRQKLIAELTLGYGEMAAVLDQMHSVARRMTDHVDLGMMQSGYTVEDVVSFGGLTRSLRTLYRRHGQKPQAEGSRIGYQADPNIADFLPLLSQFETLEKDARTSLRAREATLNSRHSFDDSTPPVQPRAPRGQ